MKAISFVKWKSSVLWTPSELYFLIFYLDIGTRYVNLLISPYLNVCASHTRQQYSDWVVLSKCFLCVLKVIQYFLSSSAKKEEEDLEDKKSIKKRVKELKVLDPKIAQNLCKYLFPLRPLHLPRTISLHIHVSSLSLPKDLFSFLACVCLPGFEKTVLKAPSVNEDPADLLNTPRS